MSLRFLPCSPPIRIRWQIVRLFSLSFVMHVMILEAIHYPIPPAQGDRVRFGWESVVTRKPTFDAIEAAIRRLDRDEWPYIWLHTQEPPKDDFSDNMFTVMGGRGEYALTLYTNGHEVDYLDNSRKDEGELVAIWESDQGTDYYPNNLCNDIELALRITRTFCETGELDSCADWERS